MADKILLVQGDTRPILTCTLTDETTGLAINITGATVLLKFREAGSTTVKSTITGAVTNGATGTVEFTWPNAALDTAGEFEGEVEITFASGGIQTVYDKIKFKVREQF